VHPVLKMTRCAKKGVVKSKSVIPHCEPSGPAPFDKGIVVVVVPQPE
jgi:hypothetical protein